MTVKFRKRLILRMFTMTRNRHFFIGGSNEAGFNGNRYFLSGTS